MSNDQDREAFACWLSGFVDGEGSFNIWVSGWPKASFAIQLRADDLAILYEIQKYFGCGSIYYQPNKKNTLKSKPIAMFVVSSVQDHLNAVIPHFTKYPLHAKKKQDFKLWVQGVKYLAALKPLKTSRRVQRWTPARLRKFKALCQKLKDNRKFVNRNLTPSQAQILKSQARNQERERAGKTKLNPDSVRSIRSSHAAGMTQVDNARKHHVGPTAVFNIVHGKKWTHVK